MSLRAKRRGVKRICTRKGADHCEALPVPPVGMGIARIDVVSGPDASRASVDDDGSDLDVPDSDASSAVAEDGFQAGNDTRSAELMAAASLEAEEAPDVVVISLTPPPPRIPPTPLQTLTPPSHRVISHHNDPTLLLSLPWVVEASGCPGVFSQPTRCHANDSEAAGKLLGSFAQRMPDSI